MEENNRPKKKIWRRVLAVLLVLTLIAAPIVTMKTEIEFSKMNYVEETAQFAAGVTEDTTGYLTENRLNRAWAYLQSLVGEPKTYHDYELYASLAIARNDFETAAKYLEGCLENADTENADPAILNLRMASLFVLQEQYEAAGKYLDKAIELNPDLAPAYYLRGQLAAEAGDAEGAIANLKQYAVLPGADPAVVVSLGEMFESGGDFKTAEMCYTAGIEADPEGSPELYVSRAKCRVLLDDMDAASRDLGKYFSLTDEDPDGQAAAVYAMCLMEDGDYEGAVEYFRKAVENGYSDPALLYSQSVKSGFAAGSYEDAVADGLKALELVEGDGKDSRPENASEIDTTELRFWIGLSYLAQDKYDEALEQLTEVDKAKSDYPDIDYYLGVCALAKEDFEKAEEYFTASIEKDEDLTACYYNRAICRIRLERLGEAKEDLNKVVERDDDEELKTQAEELIKAL